MFPLSSHSLLVYHDPVFIRFLSHLTVCWFTTTQCSFGSSLISQFVGLPRPSVHSVPLSSHSLFVGLPRPSVHSVPLSQSHPVFIRFLSHLTVCWFTTKCSFGSSLISQFVGLPRPSVHSVPLSSHSLLVYHDPVFIRFLSHLTVCWFTTTQCSFGSSLISQFVGLPRPSVHSVPLSSHSLLVYHDPVFIRFLSHLTVSEMNE